MSFYSCISFVQKPFFKLSKAGFIQAAHGRPAFEKQRPKQTGCKPILQPSRWLNAECASSTVYSTNALPHQLILQGLQQPTVSVYTGNESSIIATTACRVFI
jgi:hypothetical protein